MKNLLTKLRYVPKRFGVVAALVVAATTAALSFAWGPSRATFTVENPAPYVTFNSITNNPIDGDERNFSRAKDVSATSSSAWTDNVAVQPGKEYIVRVLVHNNAADNLNLKAVNTRASASVPTTTGKSVIVSNFVSADNANPTKVWDDITFTGTQDFNLAYVPGSARIYNSGYAAGGNGAALPDSIVTSSGAVLGYAKAGDGIIPGCFKYLSYVEYKVKPQFATPQTFDMSKSVRLKGATGWNETVATKAGDTVQYRIMYTNTSTAGQQDNVAVRDTLPAGVSLVPGTTNLFLGSDPLTPRKMSDNITGAGINIGSYAAGGRALVIFDAKVAANDGLPTCGANTLKNIAKVETDYGTKQDGADVTVDKTCAPEPKYTCDMLTVNKIDRTHFSFKTDYTVQNATFVRVDYVVRNAAGSEVYRGTNNTFTTNTVGNYTVEALVVVTVNGATKTVTSANCKKPFTVEEEPVTPVAACKQVTVNTISRTEFSFDGAATVSGGAMVSKYTFIVKNAAGQTVATKEVATNTLTANSGKVTLTTVGTYTVVLTVATSEGNKTNNNCMKTFEVKPEDKDITVCRLSDKKYPVTIKESEFNPNLYSKNPEDCKTVEDKDITVCRLSDKKYPVTIKQSAFDATKYSMNPEDCKVLEASYIKVCNLADWTIKTIKESEFDATKYSKNLDDCKEKVCVKDTKQIITINKNEFDATKQTRDLTVCSPTPTPETPTTIASTGPEAILGGLFGSSALGLGISSYVRSRAAVRSALRR